MLRIVRTWIDPAYGLQTYQINAAMFEAGFDRAAMKDLRAILSGLYRVLVSSDAMLAEINPLHPDVPRIMLRQHELEDKARRIFA